ncbi:MAG TPA: hypothetical protein PKA64_14435 [Myxococcota bacterium]|nr:hypothetical protein [Myxococcota bacterium]
MHRFALIAALAAVTAPLAAAAEPAAEACILTTAETNVGPRKPRVITLKLDCGTEPSADQQALVAAVNSKPNVADGLKDLLGAGYSIATSSSMNSFTGNAILSIYTLVKVPQAAAMAAEPEEDDDIDLDDFPPPRTDSEKSDLQELEVP